MKAFTVLALAAAVVTGATLPGAASAALITQGFTFAVADAFTGASGVGTHFHSNTGGSFGNPAGLAEVGRLVTEEVRGLSEYSLTGLSAATSAFVTFDVQSLTGLFGQGAFQGTIRVSSYLGNNTEDLSDFQAAATSVVSVFDSTGLAVGDVLSFDVTSLFNTAIGNGNSSLGIRLQLDPLTTPNTAMVFHDFRLTTDDQSTRIPEPISAALVGVALLGMGVVRRRRAAPAAR